MASIVHHPRAVEYFSRRRIQMKNHTISPSSIPWDQSPCRNPRVLSSNSWDAIDISPGSPNPTNLLPYSNGECTLPSQESNLDCLPLGDFDNWISDSDDPTDRAPFPLVEPLSTTVKSEPITPDTDTAELHLVSSIYPNASIFPTTIPNGLRDGSIAFEDSMTDEPLFQSPLILPKITNVPPCNSFHSTPLSWERYQLDYRAAYPSSDRPLSPTEESKLLSIAMPAQPYPLSPASSPSPEPQDICNLRKRKLSDSSESERPPRQRGRHSATGKRAHNMIEKRYRTSINDKIAELRDSVPSLRVIATNNSRDEDLREDLKGLSPANKLTKATVLSTATAYIGHLEKLSKRLMKENQALKLEWMPSKSSSLPDPSQKSKARPTRGGPQGRQRRHGMDNPL